MSTTQEKQEREYVVRRSTFSGYWHGYVIDGIATGTQRTLDGLVEALDEMEDHRPALEREAIEAWNRRDE